MLHEVTNTLMVYITNFYLITGLFGIVIAMAIESCCIPLPSEIVMPVAGIMYVKGTILAGTNFWVAILILGLAGALGCLLGSIIAYWIGWSGGRPLLLKYGKYILISQHDANKADHFFARWGEATAFFSRLLPVIRTFISLPAGIARMNFARFCLFTFLGSLPWCVALAWAGIVLGENLEVIGNVLHGLDAIILGGFVLLVALYVWRHIRKDRSARVIETPPSA